VGSALVRTGLERAPQFGAMGVLVLGDPAYYGRFGFRRETALGVNSPYSALPAFQALALFEGAFEQPLTVAYPSAFSD
jgi:putative acetyltransferase